MRKVNAIVDELTQYYDYPFIWWTVISKINGLLQHHLILVGFFMNIFNALHMMSHLGPTELIDSAESCTGHLHRVTHLLYGVDVWHMPCWDVYVKPNHVSCKTQCTNKA
eukprot:TRINITY_DN5009_c0_g1_i1.p1 TRINITY_DN5009_c0_g1~~TRINITY_DN5009_c0_g1_i1.p1  ORF type:complete len:109 (+),score=7.91 TRINITY_DN5009_c0_g1_i1:295-621(+)